MDLFYSFLWTRFLSYLFYSLASPHPGVPGVTMDEMSVSIRARTRNRVLDGLDYDYDYPSTGSGYLGSELSKHEHDG